jgi:hypothetical protein
LSKFAIFGIDNTMKPTQKLLLELFIYDAKTGIFTHRKSRRGRSVIPGKEAGTKHGGGYQCISVNSTKYLAHRLAWLYMTGEWPKNHIDHINGVRNDNRFKNLRSATHSDNMRNTGKKPFNTSGYKGVGFHKQTKKWRAYITTGQKLKHLGLFESAEQAHEAYKSAAKELHGEFAKF